jgi:hypothetical protein
VLAAEDHGDATLLFVVYQNLAQERSTDASMLGKSHFPTRLTGIGQTAMPAATVVAARGVVCPAERPERGSVALRLYGAPGVSGRMGGIRHEIAGWSDRLGDARMDAGFAQDNKVQAGGNDPGP